MGRKAYSNQSDSNQLWKMTVTKGPCMNLINSVPSVFDTRATKVNMKRANSTA